MSELTITQQTHKRVEELTVSGRVDSSNAQELDDKLKALIEEGKVNIVLDLSGVEYMSSAGLRAIVAALRETNKKRGDVRLAKVSERVGDVLSLAGLDSLFDSYDDVTTAVGSF